MEIELVKVDSRAEIPTFGSPGSAAFDVKAILDSVLTLQPGEQALIRTGLKLWLKNKGYALLIIPRSGLGAKGLVMAHGTGLLDSDYQGEMFVPVLNRKPYPMMIEPSDRIAQAFIVPIIQPVFVEVACFSDATERGEGGFGSTGQ